jgi:hypothetical protein
MKAGSQTPRACGYTRRAQSTDEVPAHPQAALFLDDDDEGAAKDEL